MTITRIRIRPQPQPQSQSQLPSQPANFKTDPDPPAPSTITSPKPIYPRTSPPAAERTETPPTPELTFASIFNFNTDGLWEVKAPPPLNLLPTASEPPSYLLDPTYTDIPDWDSDHGSPVVSPYANSAASSSASSSLNLSGFESISLKSLSSEELAREHDAVEVIEPPAPAFLRENDNGVHTQGRMMWRPKYIPHSRGTGLPFAIIEEEEPPEDSDKSCYSAESGSGEEQQGTKKESRATVVSDGSEESDVVDRKKRRRNSFGKRIKRMLIEKKNAVKLGLKV